MSGVMKRIIAVTVAVILIMAPLSSCFAVSEVVSEEILYLIWETLKSWGIEIVENGVSEFTENVQHWLNGTLDDYLTNELNEYLDTWITGIQWTIDTFGRRILNGTGVAHIYLFALWLKNQLNLTDNQTGALSSGNGEIVINGVTGYADALGIYYYSPSYGYYTFDIVKGNTDYPVFLYAYAKTSGGYNRIYVGAYSETPFLVQSTYYRSQNNETVYNNYTAEEYNGYYFVEGLAGQLTNYFNAYNNRNDKPYGDNPVANTMSQSEIKIALAGQLIPTSDDVDINTGIISFPPSNPSYQNGYSMIYYSDGSVAYLDIQWPESISVDNLPAAISPSGTQDPGFAGAWAPVRYFVNTFSESIGIVRTIVYGLPEQVMVIYYFILSVTVVFGAIHIFKEH